MLILPMEFFCSMFYLQKEYQSFFVTLIFMQIYNSLFVDTYTSSLSHPLPNNKRERERERTRKRKDSSH